MCRLHLRLFSLCVVNLARVDTTILFSRLLAHHIVLNFLAFLPEQMNVAPTNAAFLCIENSLLMSNILVLFLDLLV